jgi:hypothetical protein
MRPIRGDIVVVPTCAGMERAEVLGRLPPVYGFDVEPGQAEAFQVRSVNPPERVGVLTWSPNPALRVLAAIVPACRVAHQQQIQDAFTRAFQMRFGRDASENAEVAA